MGKNEGKKGKGKGFGSTPFAAIKGVQVEQRKLPEAPSPAAEPPKRPEKPDLAAEDALFLREMADLKPMGPPRKGGGKRPAAPTAPKPAVSPEESRLFLDTVTRLKLDVTFTESLTDIKPLRGSPSGNRLRQLRRGAIRIDLELDLHGLTRDEALESLATFITSAYNRGQKAVLVITGKGNNSPGEPVLLTAVSGWLREQGKGMVAEFAPAPRQLGGGGAFVVFLKAVKQEP